MLAKAIADKIVSDAFSKRRGFIRVVGDEATLQKLLLEVRMELRGMPLRVGISPQKDGIWWCVGYKKKK